MSKQANPAVIGAFVLGAVFLAVAALVVFGGGEVFKEKRRWVMFFEGSLDGLDIGSETRTVSESGSFAGCGHLETLSSFTCIE